VNLQGAGQGNTSAAPFWTCVSTPMIRILKDKHLHTKMRCPLSLEEIVLTLMAFVDDTEIFLMADDDDVEALIELAQTTLLTWKGVLQATGGTCALKNVRGFCLIIVKIFKHAGIGSYEWKMMMVRHGQLRDTRCMKRENIWEYNSRLRVRRKYKCQP